MKIKILLLSSLSALFLQSPLQAASDTQLAAISTMGELNGVALQCHFLDQVRRIKEALVLTLPKERALGEWFEQSTNTSFMDFMSNNSTCPATEDFAGQLDTAITKLEAEFIK